jgi:hypothetical protein
MKIKGELFSQQFIPKLLDGTKIRMSRPCNPQPAYIEQSGRWVWPIPRAKAHKGCCTEVCTASREWWQYLMPDQMPYQPGDIMYVRETWAHIDFAGENNGYVYKASQNGKDWEENSEGWKWHPSIHMPREAARIFLRVTDVKVQRLGDLTEQDAEEDGFESNEDFNDWATDQANGLKASGFVATIDWSTALKEFKQFWLSQYGEDAQWMWVYCFERCEKPGGDQND